MTRRSRRRRRLRGRLSDVGDQLDPMGSGDDGDAPPGSIRERVQELTGGGSLCDERNRVKALGDPELRRRSRSLLRWISNGG